MKQSGELLIIRAGGVGVYRLIGWFLLVVIPITGLVYLLGEEVVPESSKRLDALMVKKSGRYAFSDWKAFKKRERWFYKGGTLVHISKFFDKKLEYRGVELWEFSKGFMLNRNLKLAKLEYDSGNGSWYGSDIDIVDHRTDEKQKQSPLRRIGRLLLKMDFKPIEFSHLSGWPQTMNTFELYRLITKRKESQKPIKKYMLALSDKLFFPLINVAMVFMAVPYALCRWFRGGVSSSISHTLIIGAFCWVTIILLRNFALEEKVHPHAIYPIILALLFVSAPALSRFTKQLE
jgi:lipopolysaccharide export system permease protein